MTSVLKAGATLTTGQGSPDARLGLIVMDESRQLLGLTARHFLQQANGENLIAANSGIPLGVYSSAPLMRPEARGVMGLPFSETIGAFRLDQLTTDIAVSNSGISAIGDPDKAVGKAVRLLVQDTEPIEGRVIGSGGAVRFRDPYSTSVTTTHYKPLTLTLDVPERRAMSGFAGALIVDDSNDALGLLISKGAANWYAAPLLAFLDRNQLTIYTEDGSQHDENATTIVAASEMADQLQKGIETLKNDLLHEQVYHKDPRGNEVPARLVKYLTAA